MRFVINKAVRCSLGMMKSFLLCNILAIIGILVFIFVSESYHRIPQYKFNRIIDYYSKIDYSRMTVFNVTDLNAVKFDDLNSKYCSVYETTNITNECLKWLNNYDLDKVDVSFKGEIYYHTFWKPMKGKGHHMRVMKLNIYSYLATQNLKKTRLILWSVERLSVEDELRVEFKTFIKSRVLEFRILDFDALCSKGLFLLRQQECSNMHHGNSILLSDFVRFLVLYNYGGIYVDGDVIFLRDMKSFWTKNFVYRWSYVDSYNTAVMGVQEYRSEYIEKIYEIILVEAFTTKGLVDGFYPTNIMRVVERINESNIFNYTDLHVYSSVLFDAAWLCFDVGDRFASDKSICKFSEFYDLNVTKEEFKMTKFFPGAFTYHLHLGNCGSCNFSTNSYFHHIERYFRRRVEKLK